MTMRSLKLLLLFVLALPAGAFAQGKLNVVATTEDLGSLAREIGGDKVSVTSLARGYQDPHFVDPKPSFILAVSRADMLIVVGRELEIGWLPPLLTSSRNSKIQTSGNGYLDASLNVKILEIPTGQITRAMGDVHPLGNPHYWMDPENGTRIAKEMVDAFDRLRPDHRSFPNFAERFGLDIIGYVEPRPGIPPTPQHTLDLINEMKRQNVKVVRVEPYFDLKTPNSIGQQTGAQVLVMPPSVGGVKDVPDYFKLFDYDINLLVGAIQKAGGK